MSLLASAFDWIDDQVWPIKLLAIMALPPLFGFAVALILLPLILLANLVSGYGTFEGCENLYRGC
jgi:hypothetical protein